MIKRIIGIIASLAIVALIVFTVLGSGSYRSMLPEDLFSDEVVAEQPQEVSDSVAEVAEPVDSVVLDSSDMEATAE